MDSQSNGAQPKARIITIGGGKGGIGKSTVTAGIACQLSQLKKRVVLVDADLAGANLHLSMGIRYPDKTLSNFLSGKLTSIQDVFVNTSYPDVSLVSSAGSLHEMTNLTSIQKQRLLQVFRELPAEYTVIDVGAGADEDNTDFFSLSNHGVIIITNEPSSVENAYSFLKNAIIRKFLRQFQPQDSLYETIFDAASSRKGGVRRIVDLIAKIKSLSPEAGQRLEAVHAAFKPSLVVNMVRSKYDVQVEANFRAIVRNFLGLHLTYVGYVVYDDAVPASIKRIVPLSANLQAPSVKCLRAITQNLIALGLSHGQN